MPLEKLTLDLLPRALEQLERESAALPPFEAAVPGAERMAEVLAEVAHRLGDNYPYFHPLYAGQMMKPPHPVARAAYALATWINPNNHALDGGRASSAMERPTWGTSPAVAPSPTWKLSGWLAASVLGRPFSPRRKPTTPTGV